ncbi:hypothetical protein GX586_04090 [bacterium]|nr:hypothetical protein [bacterium]
MRDRTARLLQHGKAEWRLLKPDEEIVRHLCASTRLPEQIARVFVNRGFLDADAVQRFLDASLSQLHDPFLLGGLRRAADRVLSAIHRQERIVIYGDYDVDGVTSTALLVRVLRALGARVSYYVPNRMSLGYGLHRQAIEELAVAHTNLIVTVDCGINAIEPVSAAQKLGIDVVITDHHEPKESDEEDELELVQQASLFNYAFENGDADARLTRFNLVLPAAYAVVDPKCGYYPFADLAGVGVAFKLAHGVVKLARERHIAQAFDIDLKEHLDLVALGTIADAAPLRDENRILVKNGLRVLAETRKVGLRKLIELSRLRQVDADSVVFGLAPRINAAGRMGDCRLAVELLLTANTAEAELIARDLDGLNQDRQRVERETFQNAIEQFESSLPIELPDTPVIPGGLQKFLPDGPRVIVLASDEWNPGVVGIVASRMVERYYLPTVVIALQGDAGRGSCRSVRGFHIFDALRECSDLLERYGGHRVAAGVTIARSNIEAFRERLNAVVRHDVHGDELTPVLDIDAVFDLRDYTLDLLDVLEKLPPFGQSNPRPVFLGRGLNLVETPTAINDRHVRFCVMQHDAYRQVIAFNGINSKDEISTWASMDVVFHPLVDHYRETTLQLQMIDARECLQ